MAGFMYALREAGIEQGFDRMYEYFPLPNSPEEFTLQRQIAGGEITGAVLVSVGKSIPLLQQAPQPLSIVCFALYKIGNRICTRCATDFGVMGRRAADRLLSLLAHRTGRMPPEEATALITLTPTLYAGETVKKIGEPPPHLGYHWQQLGLAGSPVLVTRSES